MNIYEFAIDKEKASEAFYRQLAEDTTDKGFCNIFMFLADEEAKHCKVLEKMKTGNTAEMSDSADLSKAKKILKKKMKSGNICQSIKNELDIYKRALDFEEKSMQFYHQKATEAEDQHQKDIFNKLATEESGHYHLLENIIDFVSQPEHWLENAEFYHSDDY